MSKNTTLNGNFSIHENYFTKMITVLLLLSIIYLLSSCSTPHMNMEQVQQFQQQLSSVQKIVLLLDMKPDFKTYQISPKKKKFFGDRKASVKQTGSDIPNIDVIHMLKEVVEEWLNSYNITDITVIERSQFLSKDKLTSFLRGFDAIVHIRDGTWKVPELKNLRLKGFGVSHVEPGIILKYFPKKITYSRLYLSCQIDFLSLKDKTNLETVHLSFSKDQRVPVLLGTQYSDKGFNRYLVNKRLQSIIQTDFSNRLQTWGVEGF